MDKVQLRKQLLGLRRQLKPQQAAASSLLVTQHILACDAYKKAKCIMGYLAFGKELNIDGVLRQALQEGKQVAVPLIVSDTEFKAAVFTGFEDLELDRYGIRTVAANAALLDPAELELILVPAVAFGRDGSRMGMGAGYYDRFMPQAASAHTLGVAYAEMLQPSLPTDEHDIFMEQLVCEDGILDC